MNQDLLCRFWNFCQIPSNPVVLWKLLILTISVFLLTFTISYKTSFWILVAIKFIGETNVIF